MTNLLKNHILKPLSRFTKNLSPDQLNVSALRGEGNLTNLELDENVLMELMDLPTWLLLKKVVCNRVAVKIQWTKLKSQPILVQLDEVVVEIEALEEPRPPRAEHSSSYRTTGGKYGLIDRVLDGIKVTVNGVRIIFKAQAFSASIELSRVLVASKMANWRDAEVLKHASIRDTTRNAILLFKEISWDTTRIEANGLQGLQITPVRLITNTSRIRITLKKSLADSMVLSSRVQFLLDDLLWVLTVSQMEAAILFLKSLKRSIFKSAEQSKGTAEEKVKRQTNTSRVNSATPSPTHGPASNQAQTNKSRVIGALFQRYDIPETSYHVFMGKVELHFCEEGAQEKLSKNAVGDGSVRLLLQKINMDIFPFHPNHMDRHLWPGYMDLSQTRTLWVDSLLDTFHSQYPSGRVSFSTGHPAPKSPPTRVLMENVLVLRLEDIQMSCVSTSKVSKPDLFFGSDKWKLKLPRDMTTLFLDYTEYYYTDQSKQQLPPPNLYVQVNPIFLRLDYETLVWMAAFYLNLTRNLTEWSDLALITPQGDEVQAVPINLRLECLMPRVIIPAELDIASGQPERPTALEIQASTLVLSSVLPEAELSGTVSTYMSTAFYTSPPVQFPRRHGDSQVNWTSFQDRESHHTANPNGPPSSHFSAPTQPPRYSSPDHHVPGDSKLLYLHCQQVWLDFTGTKAVKNRPQPLCEPLPITLWVHIHKRSPLAPNHQLSSGTSGRSSVSSTTNSPSSIDINILVDCKTHLQLRMTHYQMLFLLRLTESFSTMSDQLIEDQEEILTRSSSMQSLSSATSLSTLKLVVACQLDSCSVALVMPALSEALPFPESDSIMSFVKPWATVSQDRQDCDTTSNKRGVSIDEAQPQPITPPDSTECLNTTYEGPGYASEHVTPTHSTLANRTSPDVLPNTRDWLEPPGTVSATSSPRRSSSVGEKKRVTSSNAFQQFSKLLKVPGMNMGDEDSMVDDLEQMSITGSEISESEEEKLASLLGFDELDTGLTPGGHLDLNVRRGMGRAHTDTGIYEMGQESGGMDDAISVVSSVTSRGLDVVSIVTFNVNGVDAIIGLENKHIVLSGRVQSMSVSESGRQSLPPRHDAKDVETGANEGSGPLLGFRIEIPPLGQGVVMSPSGGQGIGSPAKGAPLTIEARLLRALSLNLLMSSLVNLGDFIEDEVAPPPPELMPPFALDLHGPVDLALEEDRPCANLTCPGEHALIRLNIPPGLRLSRGKDGIIKVAVAAAPTGAQRLPVVTPDLIGTAVSMAAANQQQTNSNALYLAASGTGDPGWSSCSSISSLQMGLAGAGGIPAPSVSATTPTTPGGHTNSEELLKRYYQENVKLREKVNGLRKEHSASEAELSGCRTELDEVRRERDALLSTLEKLQGELQARYAGHKPHPPRSPRRHSPYNLSNNTNY